MNEAEHNGWLEMNNGAAILDCHWLPVRDGDPRAAALPGVWWYDSVGVRSTDGGRIKRPGRCHHHRPGLEDGCKVVDAPTRPSDYTGALHRPQCPCFV